MPYDEQLANRTRELLASSGKPVTEKNMFGGLCFMVDDKMCIGVEKERLMVRVDPDISASLLELDGCTPMDFTGKVMKGYVFVDRVVLQKKAQLEKWVKLALDFNPKAKASIKKSPATR